MKISAFAVVAFAGSAFAQVPVAGQDFDGGALNLNGVSGQTTFVDGGPGDAYGVGSIAAWPQGAGVPFSLADDSVVDVSGGTFSPGGAFTADAEGVFGQNSNADNRFFGFSDLRDEQPLSTTWSFDVSGFTDLQFSVDVGASADGTSFGGFTSQSFSFDIILDNNNLGSVNFDPSNNDGSFLPRTMDSGNSDSNSAGILEGSSIFGLTKLNADTGTIDPNTFVDKSTLQSGALDTFTTGVFSAAGGNTLEIRLNVDDFAFEAAAFDNILITGVPTPGAAALLGLAGFAGLRRRRA